jgi:isocitrate lyase
MLPATRVGLRSSLAWDPSPFLTRGSPQTAGDIENCSPSFNWQGNLSESEIAEFQKELGALSYKFQFVTLAGFHALNLGMFDLALSYKNKGMLAYSKFQQEEFAHGKEDGYLAITHQKFVGAGYFDRVMNAITEGESSVETMAGSTEKAQL